MSIDVLETHKVFFLEIYVKVSILFCPLLHVTSLHLQAWLLKFLATLCRAAALPGVLPGT